MVFFTQKKDPTMARRRGHTGEQILTALRQAEGGTTVAEICRDVGISAQTFCTWKRKYAGPWWYRALSSTMRVPWARCRSSVFRKVSNVAALNVVHREWTNVPV
jgi:hypothetical protein